MEKGLRGVLDECLEYYGARKIQHDEFREFMRDVVPLVFKGMLAEGSLGVEDTEAPTGCVNASDLVVASQSRDQALRELQEAVQEYQKLSHTSEDPYLELGNLHSHTEVASQPDRLAAVDSAMEKSPVACLPRCPSTTFSNWWQGYVAGAATVQSRWEEDCRTVSKSVEDLLNLEG